MTKKAPQDLKTRLLEARKKKNEAKNDQKNIAPVQADNQSLAKSANGKVSAKKNGRPEAITPEVEAMLESALQNGATVQRACAFAEIAERTFYYWMEKNESFCRKMDKAKEFCNLSATRLIVSDIVSKKNVDSAKWWLSKKLPAEFGDKNGSINVGVQVNNGKLKEYTD